MSQPWMDYSAKDGRKLDQYGTVLVWDSENFPFAVRWSVSVADPRVRWRDHIRNFATLEQAIAAYKRPFRGLSVDVVKWNGGPPGHHLDRICWRKARKPTVWTAAVPLELR